ncbi:MAG: hydantoinase/oxoprolinase family protein [Candidatus Thorarchaeota archaeon]|jgi:N-methylhydantoinase A
MKIIGVDVGGTFTDVILVDTESGEQYVHKVQSTPGAQDVAVSIGVNDIITKYQIDRKQIDLVVHGTTIATNAMLQRKGAKVVLLTTEGLEDVLEIGRQNRDDIYNLHAKRAEPLVIRDDRLGVRERLDSEGNVVIELDDYTIEQVTSQAIKRHPKSVAISLLFSFRNQEHEKRLLQALSSYPNIYSVASSDVLPEFREFERASTTVLEAYLGPLVTGYLKRLDSSLSILCPKSKLTVMQSNGGTMLASRAQGRAIGLAISGLAGGAIGGWEIAKHWNVRKAITLDMGGTSCDISAIIGNVVVRSDNEVGGLPLRMPSVDVKTIGAGGGSIAWIDKAGVLHVGPQSAGAVPGPAAYRLGGNDATVTDANLVLGRLNPDNFLGGKLRLDLKRAQDIISDLSSQLGLSIEETALGIIKISTANMVQAIREVTVERGSDPRSFILVPFGGAGPTQAIDIAEALDIDEILVPPHPGITSALGLVCTDLRVDMMRTVLISANEENREILLSTISELAEEAASRLVSQGAEEGDVRLQWIVDMRYIGQSHELSVNIPDEEKKIVEKSVNEFERIHQESYGYMMKGRNVEWVTARVVAESGSGGFRAFVHSIDIHTQPVSERPVLIVDGSRASAEVYRRWELATGQTVNGPAIIEQLDTTTYVGPEWQAVQEKDGVLWMRRGKK